VLEPLGSRPALSERSIAQGRRGGGSIGGAALKEFRADAIVTEPVLFYDGKAW
jgi:hypothetical protein